MIIRFDVDDQLTNTTNKSSGGGGGNIAYIDW